jgi:hypothetical protein
MPTKAKEGPFKKELVAAAKMASGFQTELQKIQNKFRDRAFEIASYRPVPEFDFPEIDIIFSDALETIQLAPLYDVHVGSPQHDEQLLDKHLEWMANTPNVFTWNGGDATENITDKKMGHTPTSNEEQIINVTRKFSKVQHKMMFSIPGNHEARTFKESQTSSGRRIADNLQVPYFSDYVFANLKWRGNNFRLLAHHGAGGAQSPGAQRNSARKDLDWTKPDLIWTGHLHAPMADTVYMTDYDQRTGRVYERGAVVIISPSYLKFFGGYAAAMRMKPGLRGLSVVTLQSDGRIDTSIHARGKRL